LALTVGKEFGRYEFLRKLGTPLTISSFEMYDPRLGYQQPVQYAGAPAGPPSPPTIETAQTKARWIEFAFGNLARQISALSEASDPNSLYQIRTEFTANTRYIIDTLGLLRNEFSALLNSHTRVLADLTVHLADAWKPVTTASRGFFMNITMRAIVLFDRVNMEIDPASFGQAIGQDPAVLRALISRAAPGREQDVAMVCQAIAPAQIDLHQITSATDAVEVAFKPLVDMFTNLAANRPSVREETNDRHVGLPWWYYALKAV
jgi:hypothetical protein